MQTGELNILDAMTALVLLVSGAFAFRRGLVSEVMSLGTWVIASIFAFTFFPLALPYMKEQIDNELLANAATGLGLFCLAIIILVPIGDYLNSFVKGPTLSSIDRSLGFVFGLVRGFLIMCLMFFVAIYIWPEDKPDDQPAWLAKSKLKPALAYGVDLLNSLVPEGADEALVDKLEQSRNAAKEAEENAKRLEEMSVPVPAYTGGSDRTPSSYEDGAREKMNEIIDRN